jgi:hypothetical protein
MNIKSILSVSFMICSLTGLFGQQLNVDSLKSVMDKVWKSDQDLRFELIDLQKKGKMETPEYRDLVVAIKKADTLNLEIVTSIIDKQGWLGPDEIGFKGSQALFLVIQHADLPTQEKYLPIIREAAKQGKTLASNLAILEDRVALRQGKKQIYGSQVWIDSKTGKKFVQPLEDPENVDKRRAEVGLPTMNEYLQESFQIKWDLNEYRSNLPIFEELKKNSKK